jgi:hypothetical protein
MNALIYFEAAVFCLQLKAFFMVQITPEYAIHPLGNAGVLHKIK